MDLFGRDITVGQPFSAESVRLLFQAGGVDSPEMLIQSLDISYRQNITRLWEIGSAKQYMVGGNTEGALNMNRVVGPKPVAGGFFRQYGDVCNVRENHITLRMESDRCGTVQAGEIKAAGVVITQVAYRVAAQDMVINEAVSCLVAKVED